MGSKLADYSLAPDEVEILASPRPGTAVAHDEGLVVVIDTQLTPELRAEGDARELQRAIQDLRREAELDLAAGSTCGSNHCRPPSRPTWRPFEPRHWPTAWPLDLPPTDLPGPWSS